MTGQALVPDDPAGPQPVECQVCGRRLRTAASRERGRGPVCDEKVNPHWGRDHSPRPARATTRRTPPAAQEPSLLDDLEAGP